MDSYFHYKSITQNPHSFLVRHDDEYEKKTWCYDLQEERFLYKEIVNDPAIVKVIIGIVEYGTSNKYVTDVQLKLEETLEEEISIDFNAAIQPVDAAKPEAITKLFSPDENGTVYLKEDPDELNNFRLSSLFCKRLVLNILCKDIEYKNTFCNAIARKPAKVTRSIFPLPHTKIELHIHHERLPQKKVPHDGTLELVFFKTLELSYLQETKLVLLNNTKHTVGSFKEFVQLFSKKDHQVYVLENEGWKVGITASSTDSHQRYSVIKTEVIDPKRKKSTTRYLHGGTHVDRVVQTLVNRVAEKIDLTAHQIASRITVIVETQYRIERTKVDEVPNHVAKEFDNKFFVTEDFINEICESDIFHSDLKYTLGAFIKLDIQGLRDATEISTINANICTLIVTNTVHANNAILEHIDQKRYGVLLLDKLTRVGLEKMGDPSLVTPLVNALDLKLDKRYDNSEEIKTLRYRTLIIMTENDDHDGANFKAFVLNFFYITCRGLLNQQFLYFSKNNNSTYIKKCHEIIYDQSDDDKIMEIFFDNRKSTAVSRKKYFNDISYKVSRKHKNWMEKKKITLRQYFSYFFLRFIKNENLRKIPHVMDGLNVKSRKITFDLLKNFNSSEKCTLELEGITENIRTSSENVLADGINLTQKCNLPLLVPARLRQTDSTRGIQMRTPIVINDKMRFVFPEEDDIFYKDEKTEFLVPIVPLILINGANSIGKWFRTKISSYNPKRITEELLSMVKKEEEKAAGKAVESRGGKSDRTKTLTPHFENFNGEVVFKNDVYWTIGKIDKVNSNVFVIKDLPIGWSVDFYLDNHLRPLLNERKNGQPALIKSIQNSSTENSVSIKIVLTEDAKKSLHSTSETLKDVLSIRDKLETKPMVAWNCENKPKIKQYNSPEEIMEEFFKKILVIYKTNLEKRKNKFEENLDKLKAKLSDYETYKMKLETDLAKTLGDKDTDEVFKMLDMNTEFFKDEKSIKTQIEETEKELQELKNRNHLQMYRNDLTNLLNELNKPEEDGDEDDDEADDDEIEGVVEDEESDEEKVYSNGEEQEEEEYDALEERYKATTNHVENPYVRASTSPPRHIEDSIIYLRHQRDSALFLADGNSIPSEQPPTAPLSEEPTTAPTVVSVRIQPYREAKNKKEKVQP